MQENEDVKNAKLLAGVVIYAVLTWLWFQLNNANDLPLVGHTDLVNGWINEHASKIGLLIDLIYFALSVAIMVVATQIILEKIAPPLVKIDKDSGFVAAIFVNFIVLVYEFFHLEFRLKLIGLTIGLFIFFVIGTAIADKILEILRPILKLTDAVETINDITNINDRDNK